MITAALVAGSDIAVRAVQALRLRHLSLELLVTIAAIGALVIGEYWESAAVTEVAITGEPTPVEKTAGSSVYTGTIAENGTLHLRATHVGAYTTLARIVQRVERRRKKPRPGG